MDKPQLPSSPSTSYLSIVSTNAPGSLKRTFSEKDIEIFVNKFSHFLMKMQLEKAKEIVELERSKVLFPANYRFWQFVMSAMSQLVTAESSYYSLSFFMPTKFTFRKENHIRDTYLHLNNEFQRCYDGQMELLTNYRENISGDVLCLLIKELMNLTFVRIELIDLYLSLSTKDWKNISVECHKRILEICAINSHKSVQSGAVFNIDYSYRKELSILKQLFNIQKSITECNMLDSLLQLKSLRDSLVAWFEQFDSGLVSKVTTPSFFLSFAKKTIKSNSTKLALLHFLNQFYQTLLSKFSLYFYDVIASFAPHGEMKSAFTTNYSLLHYVQNFVRKNNPQIVCILANQIELETPFYGFGYHKNLNKFGNDYCKPASGINEKYPPLFIYPPEKRLAEGLYANITCFVQDVCLNQTSGSTIQTSQNNNPGTNGNLDGRMRYLYDKNKDQTFFTANIESNIHLVVVYERKIQEREGSIINFFNDFLSELRFVKLFQDLRTTKS